MTHPAGSPSPARGGAPARLVRGLHDRPTKSPRANLVIWSALALLGLLVIVSAATASPARKTAAGLGQDALAGSPGASSVTRSSVASTSGSAAAAASPASTATPTAVEATGAVVVNAAGAVLPDAARTPGAINSAVTQATIHTTICVPGWTATIRPPSSYTTALKVRQLATGYAYHGDTSTADYEEDHLISLEIGGSPDSELNLWPEPYDVPDGARVKDVIENKLHDLVCAGTISLATAQHAIATDWWAAYVTYVVNPPPNP